MTGPDRVEITDEQRERARQAREKLKRDLADREGRPRPTGVNSDKFSGPIGLDDDGNLQAPLSAEERRRKDEWYRRSDELHGAPVEGDPGG